MPSIRDYSRFVDSRFKQMETSTDDLLHAALGIAGESGELVDAIKKHWAYGQTLDEPNVREELGDLLFYIQAMASILCVDLESLMAANMEKLQKRYPDGYSDKDAAERKDKIEGLTGLKELGIKPLIDRGDER